MDETSQQRQFLVTVQGIPGYWAQKTGGVVAGDSSRVWPGGTTEPEVLGGPAMPDDITITRPYKAGRDQEILARLRPVACRWRSTITVQPTDVDMVPIGRPEVYPDALLRSVAGPEVDAGSGDAGTVELVFTPSRTA